MLKDPEFIKFFLESNTVKEAAAGQNEVEGDVGEKKNDLAEKDEEVKVEKDPLRVEANAAPVTMD